jgi:hypothetical protein
MKVLPQTSADVLHASARRDVACNVSAIVVEPA